ncbi:MAG: DUF1983 domain-containing protein [Dokdonella sp.]
MSSPRRTVVPAIPTIGTSTRELTAFGNAVKEATEVAHGRRGDPLDRFVSVRDLKDAGIVNTTSSGAGGLTVTAPPATDPGAPIFTPGDPDFGNNDYTPPPAPTNVSVHHIAPSGLMVTWDPPAYDHHDHAEVFRLPQSGMTAGNVAIPPTFNLAASGFDPTKPVGPGNVHPNFAGRANGTIFSDVDLVRLTVPGQNALDAALNPSTYYYWVRFVSTANVVGPYAPNANAGASGALSIDPNLVLGLMITNVTNSNAYHTLLGLNPTLPNPILDAGGVSQYVNAQDNLLHGSINQQLVRIIGTSDNPNAPGQLPTIYQSLSTLTANVTANSVNLNQLDTWQAGLSLAASNNSGGTATSSVFSYTRTSADATLVSLTLAHPADGDQFHVGDAITLVASPGSPLAPIAGAQTVFGSGGGSVLIRPSNALAVSSGAGVVVVGVSISLSGTGSSSDPATFISLIASIFHNVYVSVDPATAIGQQIAIVQAQIGALSTTVSQVTTAQQNTNGTLDAMWSVGMQSIQGNGLVYAAGFGLGLQTSANDDGSFSTLSTFLINANQFAVMGTSAPGAIINAISLSGQSGSVTLSTAAHGITSSQDINNPNKLVFAIASGRPRGQTTDNPLSGLGLDGMSAIVTGVGGATISVSFDGAAGTGAFPFVSQSGISAFGNAAMPATNIPFIIDTTRGVVGIRGKLIVDGLVRATTGDFNTLTAGTAFIHSLQAQIVNANVVIGQRIIAGTAGSGALTDAQVSSISNYIIELANPVTSQYPLRYWRPSTGVSNFDLDKLGNIRIGGNLSVGRNAVVATTGPNLTSIGGSGSDGSEYPLWIGPRTAYGTSGEGRTESNGLFWVKDNGRAGINAQVYLGEFPLIAPTADGYITVPPSRSGGPATVFVSGVVNLVPDGDGSGSSTRTDLGATLMLVDRNTPGQPRNPRTGGAQPEAVTNHVFISNSGPSDGPPDQPQGVVAASTQFDSKATDVKNISLQGAVTVPAGQYKAFMYIWRKTFDNCGPEACFDANFYAGLAR